MRTRLDDEADVAATFQMQVWNVLSKQVELYTMGESTSLPEYDAHRLLASTCYILGVDPDDADVETMRDVVEQGADAVFSRNLRRVEEQAARVSELWTEACLSMPLLESVALKDTLESFRNFAARYEPRFFAHEIPADIDYPLCRPVPETTRGVDYVTTYLERLLIECRFLQRFDLERCTHLLRNVHPEYGELILNLFEPIATNAIGCTLAGCDVRKLYLDDEARARIASALEGLAGARLQRVLVAAAERTGAALTVDADTQAYLSSLARRLTPRVELALRHHSLSGVFLD